MKQFFISFFANLAALFLVLGAPFFLIVILMIASAANPSGKIISVAANSVLVLDMSVNVVDSPEHATADDAIDNALSGNNTQAIPLRQTIQAIKKASQDRRIKALFLHGSFQPQNFGSGFAALKELREAISAFRESKKKVYAYVEAPNNKDYYVATAADFIYMNPFGELQTPGLASEKMYFLNAFQKFGIEAQVTRVGKYKSAVEPFILNKMSDADREETTKLLEDIWGEFVTTISVRRKIDPNQFQQLVDKEGYITADKALENHLVDKLAYFGDVLKELGKIAPSSNVEIPFKQIALSDYLKAGKTPHLIGEKGSGNELAVLYLEGEIVDGWGQPGNIGGDRFASLLRQIANDDDIKAVVLRVNSPGGSAYASEVIQREILNLKETKKPVVVSMGAYAASGGYWISTFGTRIYAEPNTLTGSIGVFGLFFNFQKLADTIGITFDTAKIGNYADFETSSRPKTPQEIQLAQDQVDDIYNKFIDRVSRGRGIPEAQVRQIAEGRVWTGKEAIKINLVDKLGGLEDAIRFAAETGNMGSNYRVQEYPKQPTFAQRLAELFSGQEEPLIRAKSDILTQEFFKIHAGFKSLQNLNDPFHAYARLPLGFEIK